MDRKAVFTGSPRRAIAGGWPLLAVLALLVAVGVAPPASHGTAGNGAAAISITLANR
jgi:hypothetical protein